MVTIVFDSVFERIFPVMTKGLRRFWLVLATALTAGHAAAEVKVAATIAPVHSLASMVTEGVSEPALIVKPGASPHDYAMKPSEARALDQADVVFWVGDALEPWMEKALRTLAADAQIVELGAAEGVNKLSVRERGVWNAHGHRGHDDGPDDEEETDRGHRYDPHLWLDPDNAIVWLEAMATELLAIDPTNAQIYQANASDAAARLTDMTVSIEADLAPVKEKPYIVFHDAYQYFERRFGLNAVGAISLGDADRPSAARLTDIRQRIQESGAQCAFAEPQFEPKLLDTVIEGRNVTKGILDPMGADLEPGIELYPALIERLVISLTDCLS